MVGTYANPKAEALELEETSPDYDVEAHDVQIATPETNASAAYKLVVLALYFVLSLWITISNKSVLSKSSIPWLLTAIHTLATAVGCFVVLALGKIKLTRLTNDDHITLLAFSILFTLNIAFSNVSLAMVSVPFHQVLRSTMPLITIVIYRTVYGQTYPTKTYVSMIPLVLGVALCTAGDYYCTVLGFTLTFIGVLLSAVKAIATARIMTGSLSLSTMELLVRMSPLAAVQCFAVSVVNGEVGRLHAAYADGSLSTVFTGELIINTVIAMALNVVSFQSVKLLGALSSAVFGNVRQVLTILFGIVIFSVPVGSLSAIGMVSTTVGAIWYSKIEIDNKSR